MHSATTTTDSTAAGRPSPGCGLRRRPTAALAFLTALLLAAGCGQKGPLFLPGDPSEILSDPAEPPAGTDADEENGDNPDETR